MTDQATTGLCKLSMLGRGVFFGRGGCAHFFVVTPGVRVSSGTSGVALTVSIERRPNTLCRILKCFFCNNVGVARLRSHPLRKGPFRCFFRVSIVNSLGSPSGAQALRKLSSVYDCFGVLKGCRSYNE